MNTPYVKAAREEVFSILQMSFLYPHLVNDRIPLLRLVDAEILNEDSLCQRGEILERLWLVIT